MTDVPVTFTFAGKGLIQRRRFFWSVLSACWG